MTEVKHKTSFAQWLDSGQKIAWFFGIIIATSGTVALAFNNIGSNTKDIKDEKEARIKDIQELKADFKKEIDLHETKDDLRGKSTDRKFDRLEKEIDDNKKECAGTKNDVEFIKGRLSK